jgi:hypothetical protein
MDCRNQGWIAVFLVSVGFATLQRKVGLTEYGSQSHL